MVERLHHFPSTLALFAILLSGSVQADELTRLAEACARFEGVGDSEVVAYRVPVTLPEEPDESIVLEEIWRAGEDLALRGADATTPAALVRSLALYLEPFYVARSVLVRLDLRAVADRLREVAGIKAGSDSAGTWLELELPAEAEPPLPEVCRELERLAGRLDEQGRLTSLELTLRESQEAIELVATYGDEAAFAQPGEVRWVLPSGDTVVIRSTFRRELGRWLPQEREIVFPSRFDPAETERIVVCYGPYELNDEVPTDVFSERRVFRFDSDGLISD
jgi:hypothetical protein